jgi:hypothetical protein
LYFYLPALALVLWHCIQWLIAFTSLVGIQAVAWWIIRLKVPEGANPGFEFGLKPSELDWPSVVLVGFGVVATYLFARKYSEVKKDYLHNVE